MQKTVLTILAASLIAGSTVQIAGAAERYAHKSDRARVHTTERFRDANESLGWPAVDQQDLSDYSEGHVISAPAGQ
jgi:Ni/Co efflux regulator RcnB